jgi:hypothetical protein
VPDTRDHYQAYYQDKLWNLLPAIYRTLDTDTFTTPGPLRELVNRIGAQAAILRRSIDRLWEDQSIETCDDWVVSYIADLLATNLVASLDPRGQRLDVANTIYFRRRKGTVSILEEIAADITGWDARVVEFFRRLGRTRHNFDPEIGLPAEAEDPAGGLALQLEEGLVGFWTHTAIGGWADLRNRYGATKSTSAFDEYFHTADFRRGVDMVGWHNIPRLGVFLWRLYSFGVDQSTPVEMTACPGQFTFDPTGRQIQLFTAASRTRSASFGDQWVSPSEWQLPGPITTSLMQAALKDPGVIPLYAALDSDGVTILPNSLGVFTKPLAEYALLPITQFIDPATKRSTIFPELGRFRPVSPPAGESFFVTYHYGFSSTIGAGPYDRRIPSAPTTLPPAPVVPVVGGTAVSVQTPSGTTRIIDSLTYTTVNNAAGISNSRVEGAALKRPVLRLPAPSPGVSEWILTGANDQSVFSLEGLLISGGDVILRGAFATVTLTCCTLDPGNTGDGTPFAQSVDGRDLRPTRLWIEGDVATLTIDRCICGPIRIRGGGSVIAFTATDSIIQGIRTSAFGSFAAGDVEDPIGLTLVLRDPSKLSVFLRGLLDAPTQAALAAWDGHSLPDAALLNGLLAGLNAAVNGPSIYDAARFDGVPLSPETRALLGRNPTGADLARLNRLLLEDAYPEAIGQDALALPAGTANLSRCTVLGRLFVHRLHASECILDDFAEVEDTQHGCVRFSAWTTGSVLPRQFESVQAPPRGPLFVSREFADPGYAQLLPTADRAVIAPSGKTILEGAEDGSEMGVFAREKIAIKERSLLIKYQEFMPLGLVPVVIHVT